MHMYGHFDVATFGDADTAIRAAVSSYLSANGLDSLSHVARSHLNSFEQGPLGTADLERICIGSKSHHCTLPLLLSPTTDDAHCLTTPAIGVVWPVALWPVVCAPWR